MSFEPIKTKRLYQEIADQVFDLIARGAFKAGERLPAERDLAARMEVSRATVREAMIALEIAGAVDIRTGSGVFVIGGSQPANIAALADAGPGPFELIEARTAFESEAAALAAVRISEAELSALEASCRELDDRYHEHKNGEDIDYEFHRIIMEATRNSAIIAMLENLWRYRKNMPMWRKLYDVIREIEARPDWNDEGRTVVDHKRIVDALRTRDPDRARQAMKSHLDRVRNALLRASELDMIDLSSPNGSAEQD